ncbi:hypothetical protein FHR99_003241 [Litorivivens lipolytica]|uniref:Uncharacterized protein n=1 Tax=Litorivivens lipolytica TaxID=1524264 RepID=A0A7W4W7P1_9GAMM|nr:hypothetical protein [Litorivivens lipolytica]MBB3048967.1 hypothetical protein [Litorivivens lipolytica]
MKNDSALRDSITAICVSALVVLFLAIPPFAAAIAAVVAVQDGNMTMAVGLLFPVVVGGGFAVWMIPAFIKDQRQAAKIRAMRREELP